MENLAPAKVDPRDLPEGFVSADPNNDAATLTSSSRTTEANGQEEQKQAILQQALEPDALARLRRIKLVKHEKVTKLESQIVSLAMLGKLPGRINEEKLIEMLERSGMSQSSSVNTKISIQRKKYAFDSDDDDDNDDDLM